MIPVTLPFNSLPINGLLAEADIIGAVTVVVSLVVNMLSLARAPLLICSLLTLNILPAAVNNPIVMQSDPIVDLSGHSYGGS